MPELDEHNGDGDCYEVAANMVLEMPIRTLCHGTVTGQGPLEGVRFGHAWVELGEVVFDFSNGHSVVTTRTRYYEIGEIREEDVRRYSGVETYEMLVKHEHYGPWE